MNEDFVTYEQAIKLKELGFDCDCDYHYVGNRDLLGILNLINVHEFYHLTGVKIPDDSVFAPTLAQAQKWLREKRIYLYIKPLVTKSLCVFEYVIDRMDTIDRIESKPQFDTYEQALSVGIEQALELLKQK